MYAGNGFEKQRSREGFSIASYKLIGGEQILFIAPSQVMVDMARDVSLKMGLRCKFGIGTKEELAVAHRYPDTRVLSCNTGDFL